MRWPWSAWIAALLLLALAPWSAVADDDDDDRDGEEDDERGKEREDRQQRRAQSADDEGEDDEIGDDGDGSDDEGREDRGRKRGKHAGDVRDRPASTIRPAVVQAVQALDGGTAAYRASLSASHDQVVLLGLPATGWTTQTPACTVTGRVLMCSLDGGATLEVQASGPAPRDAGFVLQSFPRPASS